MGRPMADHCASILLPRRCVCLPPASFEWPVSDRPPWRPLCDCFEHAQNFTAIMASMAMPERPVYHPWTTKATVLPPFCLQRRPGQFCGCTMEAERSQPLCKVGISDYYKVHCEYLWSAEGNGGAPTTQITCNRQVFFPLVPTVYFVAIQTRTMAKRMGMNWSVCKH